MVHFLLLKCGGMIFPLPRGKIINSGTRSSFSPEKTNDDFDVDDMMISKVAGKRSEEQEDVKRRNRAAAEQNARKNIIEKLSFIKSMT